MKKLRWAMDSSGFWDLDMSTPVTLEGTARPAPGHPLPLGLSRGIQLARSKQLDFMHKFMSMPFVPSYAPADGFSLHRALSLPLGENWFATLLGQFNLQKYISSIKKWSSDHPTTSTSFNDIGSHLCNRSLYALGFCSEYLITPDCSLLLNSEAYNDTRGFRNKAVLCQRFLQHNLTVEAVWPGLFVDKLGTYWENPLSVNVDLASVGCDSGLSYHVCLHHTNGTPKQFGKVQTSGIPPPTLLPGLCIKSAFAIKKDAEIWKSRVGKLKMVQPYDVFLSDPHVSLSGIIGAAASASYGHDPEKVLEATQHHGFRLINLCAQRQRYALMSDFFASFGCTAQHGNFQRLLFDLTRLTARLDFHSGSTFLGGVAHLARNIYNSRQISPEAIHAISPDLTVSFQQQIIGPFSIRADSHITLNLKGGGEYTARVDDSVIALEYALKVLGSAKATAWYSTKKQEAMVELRFFES